MHVSSQCSVMDIVLEETLQRQIVLQWSRSYSVQFSLVAQSCLFAPHELQHARPPCPSPTPGVHPNPCPLSRWCHPATSSCVVPFSSCPQSLPGVLDNGKCVQVWDSEPSVVTVGFFSECDLWTHCLVFFPFFFFLFVLKRSLHFQL